MRRRADKIARPARVRMRRRKPCVLERRRLLGWKVRLDNVFHSTRGCIDRRSISGSYDETRQFFEPLGVRSTGPARPRTRSGSDLLWTCGTGRHRIRPANGTFWRRAGSTRALCPDLPAAPSQSRVALGPSWVTPGAAQPGMVAGRRRPGTPTRRTRTSGCGRSVDPQPVDLLDSGPPPGAPDTQTSSQRRGTAISRSRSVVRPFRRGGWEQSTKTTWSLRTRPGGNRASRRHCTTCGQRCGRPCLVARSPTATGTGQTSGPDIRARLTARLRADNQGERDAAWIQDTAQATRTSVTTHSPGHLRGAATT